MSIIIKQIKISSVNNCNYNDNKIIIIISSFFNSRWQLHEKRKSNVLVCPNSRCRASSSRFILTHSGDFSDQAENSNAYVQTLGIVADAGRRVTKVSLSENTY